MTSMSCGAVLNVALERFMSSATLAEAMPPSADIGTSFELLVPQGYLEAWMKASSVQRDKLLLLSVRILAKYLKVSVLLSCLSRLHISPFTQARDSTSCRLPISWQMPIQLENWAGFLDPNCYWIVSRSSQSNRGKLSRCQPSLVRILSSCLVRIRSCVCALPFHVAIYCSAAPSTGRCCCSCCVPCHQMLCWLCLNLLQRACPSS